MINSIAVGCMARALAGTSEIIRDLTESASGSEIQTGDELSEVYEVLILDELNHIQIMTLELTKLLTGEATDNEDGSDGSVFAAGDLDYVEGEDDE